MGMTMGKVIAIAKKFSIQYGSVGISSIAFLKTNPNGDNIYRMNLADGSHYDFTVPKGTDGKESFLGLYDSLANLQTAHATADTTQFALIKENDVTSLAMYDGSKWVLTKLSDLTDLFQNVNDNAVPYKKADGTFADSGLTVLKDGTPYFERDPQIKSNSLRISDSLELNEKSAVLGNHSNITGYDYLMVDVRYKKAEGTERRPSMLSAIHEKTVVINSDFNTDTSVDKFSYIPKIDSIVTRLYFKLKNPVQNLCFAVKSKLTNEYVHYYPDRKKWEDDQGGYNLNAGDVEIDIFTMPLAPLASFKYDLEFEFNQTVDFLGDGIVPYFAVDRNPAEFKGLALLEDFGAIDYEALTDADGNRRLVLHTPDGTSRELSVDRWFNSGEPRPDTPFKTYSGFSNVIAINEAVAKGLTLNNKYHVAGDYQFTRNEGSESYYWIVVPSDKIGNTISVSVKEAGLYTTLNVNNNLTIDGVAYKAFKSIHPTHSQSFTLNIR